MEEFGALGRSPEGRPRIAHAQPTNYRPESSNSGAGRAEGGDHVACEDSRPSCTEMVRWEPQASQSEQLARHTEEHKPLSPGWAQCPLGLTWHKPPPPEELPIPE
eukprot:2296817-Pyramimonas_sp.AAC.1